LRQQRIRDRRVEADRPAKERLAAHAHHVFEGRRRAFVPARQKAEIIAAARDAHRRQMQADHCGIGYAQLIL